MSLNQARCSPHSPPPPLPLCRHCTLSDRASCSQFEGGVVFVSHDERLIEMVADELWVVNRGEGGQPGTVRAQPACIPGASHLLSVLLPLAQVSVWHSSFEEYKQKLETEYLSKMVSNNTVKGLK